MVRNPGTGEQIQPAGRAPNVKIAKILKNAVNA